MGNFSAGWAICGKFYSDPISATAKSAVRKCCIDATAYLRYVQKNTIPVKLGYRVWVRLFFTKYLIYLYYIPLYPLYP
jgi:hypothetical protein